MPFRQLFRPAGYVAVTLCLASTVLGGVLVPASGAAAFAARASVSPGIQYLGDSAGTTFTFTISNTSTTQSIGAVEIDRPGKSWTITGCPGAPVGWTAQRSDTMCRYRSGASLADDIAPGGESSAFKVTATSSAGSQNLTGTWPVVVSRNGTFDKKDTLAAAAAAPPGLGITVHSFQVLDVVVDPETTTPGDPCPTASKSAESASTGHTLVVCGRNRTTGTLTPTAARSSLAGTFISSADDFTSGPIAPTTDSRILGSWEDVTIATALGDDKTVIARIGSATNRTSPLTTLEDYEITSAGANTDPVADDDEATVAEDSSGVTVDVLGNDSDADGDALSVSAIDDAATDGMVTNNGTDVTYDPNGAFDSLGAGESATDTFEYTVSDGNGGTDTASVTITVTGVATPNTDPAAVDDVKTVAEDSSGVVVDVLDNDSDADGDALSVSAIDDTGTDGAVTNNGTDVTYDPNGAFDSLGAGESATDTFEYTVSDGNGGTDTASVTITVTGVATPNTDPVAVDDEKTVAEDSSGVVVDVLDNDTDADGDALSVSDIDQTGTDGVVTNNGTDVTYDPSGAFDSLGVGESTTDTFGYTVADESGGTDTGTVTITVTGVNGAPVIADIETAALGYVENAPATPLTATGSVSDVDSDDFNTGTLTVSFSAGGQAEDRLAVPGGTTIGTVSGGTNGSTPLVVTLNATATPAAVQALLRSVTYRNVSNAPSTVARTVRFVVTDGDGGTSAPVTRGITVTPVNDDPVAANDAATVAEDAGTTVITVLGNDTDADGDTLAVVGVTGTPQGTVTNNGTDVSYDPNGAFDSLGAGETATDTFGYTVSDGHGGTDTATVTITVTGVATANVPPVAVDDSATVGENDGPTVVAVLGNDTDANGDSLAVLSVNTIGTTGTVTHNGTTASYSPNGAFEALAAGQTVFDTFRYTVSDGNGGTDTAIVTITVTGSNDAPVVAGIETAGLDYTENDVAMPLTATGTVVDVDSDNLATGTLTVSFTAGGQAEDRLALTTGTSPIGTVVGGSNGSTPLVITLNALATPAAVQVLLRSVTYRNMSENPSTAARTVRFVLTDGDGGTSAPVTRGVTVTAVDDAPVAVNDTATVGQDAPATAVLVLANDTDVDGGPKTIPSASDPANGVVVLTGGSVGAHTGLTYEPDPGYCNTGGSPDTFTYVLNGGDSATVSITVDCTPNTAPVAANDSATVGENAGPTVVAVLGNDTDVDGDTLAVTGLSGSPLGLVTNNGTDVSYSPNGAFEALGAGQTATDSFTYTVSDGNGGTDSAVVTITITGANDAPVIAAIEPSPLAYTENAAATPITASGTVADVDSANLATGTLTVSFTAGGAAEDRLAVAGGTTIGTVVGGTNGTTPLVITLNTTATPTAVQTLLRSITYANVSNNPSTAARTVRFVLTDGDGGTSAPVTRGIAITAVDDAPVAVNDTATVGQDAPATAVPVLTNDTDVDGGPKTISSASDPANGVVVLTGGSVGAHTGLTYEPDPGYCNTGGSPDTFTYVLNGGDSATVSITVDCTPNTAPVADDDTATIGENAGPTVVPVLVGDTDADGDTLVVSATDTTGTTGVVTNNGTDVSYNPNGAFEFLGAGQTATDSFTYTVSDGNGGTDDATVTITVTGVNDAPVIAAIESAPLAYTENAAATPITATGTVADVDSANLATGTLTVDFSAGGLAEDRLAVAGGTTIGTVSGGTNGTTPLVITLNTTATPAAVQALLRSVTYANVSNNPSTAARTVRFVLTDGDGGTSNAPTRQVNVSAANDAPVIAAIESAPLAYTENAAATPITATGTVADADSVDLAAGTLTVSFTAGGAAEDRLAVAGGTTIGTIVGGTNGSTPLVITLNATATPAAVQALLRSVTYANVSNNPSTAARTVRFVLTDGDGGTSAPVTRGITVTAVNDLPVAVNDAATVAENTGPTVVTVLGNDTDADGDTLAVSGLGVGSTLGLVTNNGTDVSYNPNGAFEALGAGQTATDTFTYTVSDGNGGTDTAAVTITITGANDAPVIAAIEAGALSYTENAAATPITATGTVADVDSANLATGTLTVSFTAGGAAEDRLAVAGGTTIGTVVGGTNGTTPLVITLNATATPAAVQALLRSVTYANVSNNPSTAARTVRFVLTDGDGGTSNAATRGIAVTAIDDAPVAVNDTATMSQDAPATAVPVLTNDTDVDGGPKTISSASDPANGQVILTGGSVGAHTGLTYEPDPGYCNTGGSPDTFTYVLNGGDSATVSITVTCAVNGAPVIAAVETTPLAVTENDPYAPITATGTVTDSDSPNFATGTLTVDFSVGTQPADQLGIRNEGLAAGQIGVSGSNVTYGGTTIGTFAGGVFDALVVNLNASATPAAVQALLRNVTYRSLSDAPAPSRTVRFVLTDGDGGTSNAATRAITVAPENDPPVLLMGDPTPLVYDAGDPATVITPNSSVNDPDSANFDTGSLFVDFLSGGQAEDRLEILNQGTGAGQIGVSGANVTYGGTTIGTFSGGSGLTPLVVTFNANVTPPVAQAVLRVITYRNVAASPVTTNRSVRFIMADGGGGLTGTSGPVFRTITVSAPAAPPVVTTSAGTTAYTENGAALVVDGAVTVTDTDNANLAGATVQITGGLVSAQDTLSLTPPSGITVGYDAATGKLTLSGNALVATYQTALRGVRYSNSSENPATANRTVTFVANDGTAPSNSATKTVSVAAVNDPPLVGLEGAVLAYTENAAATPITVTGPLTDPDSANFAGGTYTADFSVGGQAEDRLAIRNQGVAAGQIGVSGANVTYGGTTIGTFAGGNPGTTPLVVTLNASATPTAVQALHRNVTYANASNNPVTASRTVRVVVSDGDGGTSGAGIRTITVASVNDAPAVSVFEAAALAYTENAAATPITATVTVTDVDSADFATGTLTVDFSAGGLAEDRLAVAGGTTIGTVVGGTNGTTPLVITLNATATPAAVQALLRSITYANVSESPSTAARTVRAVVTDGDGGTSATRTRTINVTAVEDAPVVTASAGTTPYTEQAAATVVDPGLTATDLDAGNVTGATVTVVSALAGDTLHFTTQGTITGVFASNVLTLSGTATLAQYQAALRTVQFSNASNNAPGATRVIGFRITAPVASNTSNKTIAITQVNDPSVVNLDGAGGLPYAEQAGSVNAFGPAATVVDPDSATLASLSVTVSAGFDASFDTVRLNPTITGFTPTFTGGVLTLTRAGGTVAEYQNALRNVQFGNTDNDPDHRNDGTPNALDASRTLSVVVNDGTLTSSPVTRVVTIAPINDAPAAPSVLPTVAGVRNTTLVSGVTTPEPHVVRSAVPFVGNAVDPDNLESAISVVPVDSVTTSSGGIIGLLANGSLRYEPPASGTLASDTYAYTLTDGTSPSAPITFTISLSGAIWYVADQAIVGANGTAVRPFATVAAALAAAPAGQPVHIRRSFGDGILSGAIVLGAGDKLLGEGVALTNVEVGTATVETLFPATGTRPVLTASGVDVVTLASNTTVAGVSINADGAANGVFGNATAGVTLRSMDVNDTGAAATQPAIETTGVGNGLTFTSPVSLITTSAGALTLAGTALAGTVSVQVSGSTSGPGISLTNTTGSLTFSSANITATGQSAIVLSSAGTVLFPAASNVSAVSNGAKALDVISTNLGSSVFDLVTSIASTTGGVRFNSVSGTPTLGDGVGTDVSLDITSGSTPAFDIASSNTVTVDAAGTDVIVAVGGPAVDIRNSLGSTYGFDSVSSTNSAGDGINLDTNVGTLFSATGGVISGASGIGLDVNGGGAAGDVTVNTRIENGPGPLSVEVTGRDGGVVTVSGDISDGADVGGGIAVTDNSGGAVNFTGATKVVNTGTSNGVVLTSNNAATSTNFTGGGLNALAGAGSGFLASGGGTVTVTGAGNVISTLAGTALSITSTTIGAADLTFQNISANGAPSGIVLNNTGTVGNLNVTGTGAAPTGGQILNTTGPGVSLTDTDGASFNNLRIAGTNRSGVQGVGVTGFSFTNGIILGAGDSAVDDNDSSIAFNTTTGGQNNNVDGVVTITGNQFSQAYGGGIDIFNYAGTITNANISNNQVSSLTDPAVSRRSGIALNLFGSTTTVASLTTATISGNTVTGFPSGDGISIQGANTASASAPAGTYGTPGGAPVTITGNFVIGDPTNKINGFGISASVTGRGQGNFVITNNGSAGSPLQYMKSSAIAIGAAGDVTAYFTVTGNRISANNGFGSSGIALGVDKNIQADLSTLANAVVRATITGNTVANTSGGGLRVLNHDTNGSLDLRVENNTITNVLGPNAGISIENGSSGNVAYNPTMCASVANNNVANGPADGFGDQDPGIALRKGSTSATTYKFGLVGLAPSPATALQTEAYVTGLNPLSAVGAGFYAGKRVYATGSNYTSCTLPPGV